MIDLVAKHAEQIGRLCRERHVKRLELFGSAVDPDRFDPASSDIDFLVEFLPLEPGRHADSYFQLLEDLQDLFGCSVDLVEARAIKNPYLLQSVNESRNAIYAA